MYKKVIKLQKRPTVGHKHISHKITHTITKSTKTWHTLFLSDANYYHRIIV